MIKPSRVVTCLLLSTVLLAAGCDKLKSPLPSTGASAPQPGSPPASAVK